MVKKNLLSSILICLLLISSTIVFISGNDDDGSLTIVQDAPASGKDIDLSKLSGFFKGVSEKVSNTVGAIAGGMGSGSSGASGSSSQAAPNPSQISKKAVEKAKADYNTRWNKAEYYNKDLLLDHEKRIDKDKIKDIDTELTNWVNSNKGAFTEEQLANFDTGEKAFGFNGRSSGSSILSTLNKNSKTAKEDDKGFFDFLKGKSKEEKEAEKKAKEKAKLPFYIRWAGDWASSFFRAIYGIIIFFILAQVILNWKRDRENKYKKIKNKKTKEAKAFKAKFAIVFQLIGRLIENKLVLSITAIAFGILFHNSEYLLGPITTISLVICVVWVMGGLIIFRTFSIPHPYLIIVGSFFLPYKFLGTSLKSFITIGIIQIGLVFLAYSLMNSAEDQSEELERKKNNEKAAETVNNMADSVLLLDQFGNRLDLSKK